MTERSSTEDSMWAADTTKEMKKLGEVSPDFFMTARSTDSKFSQMDMRSSWWTPKKRIAAFVAVVAVFVLCLGLGLGLSKKNNAWVVNSGSSSSGVDSAGNPLSGFTGTGPSNGGSGDDAGDLNNKQGTNNAGAEGDISSASSASASGSSSSSSSSRSTATATQSIFIPHGIFWNSVLPSVSRRTSTSTASSRTQSTVSTSSSSSTTSTTSSTTTEATTAAPSPSPTTETTTSTTTSTTTTTTTVEWTPEPVPSPSPQPPPPPPPAQSWGGSVGAIIDRDSFNNALSGCGIYVGGLYEGITGGLGISLPGGRAELALLMGNMAWESGNFVHTTEQGCGDGNCQGGYTYHGRGYIQLTWEANYQAAADALGRQDIHDNPDVVAYDSWTNWSVTGWYWASRVQPALQNRGYTIGASVSAINGGIECNGGTIWAGRISKIQCFQGQFGVPLDWTTWC
ncbi:lysozyme-like domain-containing protein [Obelidium mucronatum]|nr:lysozyme-like domain-containing protein [Obelidium mucronatum]